MRRTHFLAGLMLLAAVPAALAAGDENIFAGDLGNVIWTTIIFGIVVYILGTKAWPPLLKVLNERERTIRESLETAKAEREQAQKLLVEYQAQLNKAREQATALVEEGRRDAEVVRQRIQQEAKADADAMVERAKREIQLATDAAVKQLYDQTADLAVTVAGRIIQKSLSPDDHRGLVTESLERMKSAAARRN